MQNHTSYKISAIIPIRNRAGIRLENCLRSLRWQENFDENSLEIIISDFGSSAEEAQQIELLAQKFKSKVIYTEVSDYWNRSRALNVGIKKAEGKVVFCTDADMIFENNFLSCILSAQSAEKPSMVVCKCWDLPEMEERVFELKEYDQLKLAATLRKSFGTGACQATDNSWFQKVRGYDEKYMLWGFEDTDMKHRAQRDGLELHWIHEKTSMLHQWHQNIRNTKLFLKYANKARYYLTRNKIVKNSSGWG